MAEAQPMCMSDSAIAACYATTIAAFAVKWHADGLRPQGGHVRPRPKMETLCDSRCVLGFENADEAVRTSHDDVVWPRAAR